MTTQEAEIKKLQNLVALYEAKDKITDELISSLKAERDMYESKYRALKSGRFVRRGNKPKFM